MSEWARLSIDFSSAKTRYRPHDRLIQRILVRNWACKYNVDQGYHQAFYSCNCPPCLIYESLGLRLIIVGRTHTITHTHTHTHTRTRTHTHTHTHSHSHSHTHTHTHTHTLTHTLTHRHTTDPPHRGNAHTCTHRKFIFCTDSGTFESFTMVVDN